MTTTIDDILSRAALVQEPYDQADVSAAEERLRQRLHRSSARPVRRERKPEPSAQDATRGLRTLCEAVVTATGLEPLEAFLSDAMPHPLGARVLGCALQLAGCEDEARFWWQYAAGADDATSHYCLYLHHLAHGEIPEATWWREQMGKTTVRTQDCPGERPLRILTHKVASAVLKTTADTSLATTLRVLSMLKAAARSRHMPDAIVAVLDYLPLALTQVDADLDLPLPTPGFTRHVRRLSRAVYTPAPEGEDIERQADKLIRRDRKTREECRELAKAPEGVRVVEVRQEGQLAALG